MKRFFRFLTSAKTISITSFLLNLSLLFVITYYLNSYLYIYISATAFVVALIILSNSSDELVYKFSWFIAMVILPIYGATLYIYLKSERLSRNKQKKWEEIEDHFAKYFSSRIKDSEHLERLKNLQCTQANYLSNVTRSPVVNASKTRYLDSGEKYFKELLKELSRAKKYIYLQYFIIKPGKIWDRIIKILKQKALQGVEIKILYDDFGCLDNFSKKYIKELESQKIIMRPFNKIRPTVNRFINYRDHRKIAIVDGIVVFTGGINIGDEYANLVNKYGYWKDCGVKVHGKVVLSFIVLFATNWEIATNQRINVTELEKEVPNINYNTRGYVQAFGSGPITKERVARDNYLKMISNSKSSIYISSPYFILDSETMHALKLSSRSGVDVRIILPGTPDKKFVYFAGRSYYKELMQAGVKIYEYTPGFNHSKIILTDNNTACVGTINFDFRSLYLHFENAIVLYNTFCIKEIEKDFETMFSQSHLVTMEEVKSRNFLEKSIANILKLISPML